MRTNRFVVAGLVILAASSAFAYDENIGWVTNDYFAATASGSEPAYINGTWQENAPTAAESKFPIESTQTVFHVTKDRTSSTRRVIKVDCDFDYSDFAIYDDVTNDVSSAIAAITLVTNETTGAMNWMVITNGNLWGVVGSAASASSLGSYKTRVELDYNTSAQPLVRYSISNATLAAWTVLKNAEDVEWFNTAAAAPIMSNVCFCGKTSLSSIHAKLSTTAAAEVNETDYPTLVAALSAAASNDTVVLYQDATVTVADLKGVGGDKGKKFNIYQGEGGKALTLNSTTWTSSQKTGVTATYENGVLTVSAEKALVAKIASGDTDVAYLTLTAAFDAATDGQTVVAITNITECAQCTNGCSVVFDTNGFVIKYKENESGVPGPGNESPLTVGRKCKGDDIYSNTQLLIVGGGSFIGATNNMATVLSVGDGGVLVIDGIFATNRINQRAIQVSQNDKPGGNVIISNGCFRGTFYSDDEDSTRVDILGGYYDISLEEGATNGITATGGKFANQVNNLTLANGYGYTAFAVPVTTNNITFNFEVMTNLVDSKSATIPTHVWSVTNNNGEASIGGVQLPDAFVTNVAKAVGSDILPPTATASETQQVLNAAAAYGGGKATYWQCYVLGITNLTSATEGPCVKGIQDNKVGTIGFNIMSPELIKAKESGCDVQFEVEEYTDPTLTPSSATGKTTGKLDCDKTAEISAPVSGVRYYKLKMHISPKK